MEKLQESKPIANEIKASMKDLQEFLKKLTQKVKDLKILQDSGFGVDEELMDDEFKDLRIFFDVEDSKNTCSDLLKKVTRLTTQMLKIDPNRLSQLRYMQMIEDDKKRAMGLYQRLIEVELDCLKYNLPKVDQIQELGNYEKELQKYMKTWKDEAKIYRTKGYKTFKELLQQNGQCSLEGRMTFKELKHIVIDTEANLARLLVELLFLLTRTTKELAILLDWVKTALECIIVEDNSITIDIVLEVLEQAETQSMEEKLIIPSSSDEGNGSIKITWVEGDIFHKILREYVRFEVCFCCPSLPFMYSNNILRSMGELFKIHSEKKMKLISKKIDELKVEKATRGDVEVLKMNQLKLIFFSHIEANKVQYT